MTQSTTGNITETRQARDDGNAMATAAFNLWSIKRRIIVMTDSNNSPSPSPQHRVVAARMRWALATRRSMTLHDVNEDGTPGTGRNPIERKPMSEDGKSAN